MATYRFSNGYRQVARVRGIPIFVHWTLLLGGLVPAFFVGFHLQQYVYFCIGYVLLIAVHEFGHVLAAWACGLDVLAMEISGLGGMCRVEKPRTLKSTLLLYSGGLLAQAVLFVATLIFVVAFGNSASLLLNCLVLVFTLFNVIIFVGNLIPIRGPGHPTDGLLIWGILRQIWRGHA
jgi:Zn-dependent protease